MRRILSLVALLSLVFLTGCPSEPRQKPPPPQPEIKVERSERTGAVVVTVYYLNHNRQQNCGNSYATVSTLEEIRAYKKQAEFLVSQLDEAEKRMATNEQK